VSRMAASSPQGAHRRPLLLVALAVALLVAAQVLATVAAPKRDIAGLGGLPAGEFAGTLLLGGFRGLACDLLWLRAVSAKEAGRFYESVALAEAITRVQPRFADVWQHLAHDLAYNISFEADGPDQRYSWFAAGTRANARGVERNPGVERLLRHLAWMFHHKGDLFHSRIEAQDWAEVVNPLLAVVRERTGDATLAAALPAGPGNSNFAIAHRLYAASVALGDQAQRDGRGRQPAFVRRMAAHTLDADGNRLRNRGEHLQAIAAWIAAGEEWQRVQAWMDQPVADDGERRARSSTAEVLGRSEGRVRRKAAALALHLAPDAAAGTAVAEVILARNWDEARRLLAQPGWKRTAGAEGRIRWLDE
jgi:hypothetical protein